jgi:hypothetical protein
MATKYFTTADGRIVRGEVVSLPVLACNYTAGIAVYAGNAKSLDEAQRNVWEMGYEALWYDHRPAPQVCIQYGSHSIVADNGETYHEWIEVPVAPTAKVA